MTADKSFWSEREKVAITDEKALGRNARYRETVKYRAKAKILTALDAFLEVENPRIVTDRIVIKTFDALEHFLRLRNFENEADELTNMKKEVAAKLALEAAESDA